MEIEARTALINKLLNTGLLSRFRKVMEQGYGPTLPALALLESDVQLFREDLESCLEEDARLYYSAWMEEEVSLQEIRLCEVFLKGLWYERNHPNQWEL